MFYRLVKLKGLVSPVMTAQFLVIKMGGSSSCPDPATLLKAKFGKAKVASVQDVGETAFRHIKKIQPKWDSKKSADTRMGTYGQIADHIGIISFSK